MRARAAIATERLARTAVHIGGAEMLRRNANEGSDQEEREGGKGERCLTRYSGGEYNEQNSSLDSHPV